jgi:O-antigen/teichoic acid export membrane protein
LEFADDGQSFVSKSCSRQDIWKLNRDVRNLLMLLVARGAKIPVALLSTALLGRQLGPEGVGLWVMIVAAGTLLHSVLINWTHAISVRFGCEEWSKEHSLDDTYGRRMPLMLGGALIALVLVALVPLDWLQLSFGLPDQYAWVVLAYVFSVWFLAELQSLMQITGRYSWLGTIPAVTELGGAIFLGTILLVVRTAPAPAVLAGLAAVLVATPAVIVLTEWRRARLRWRIGSPSSIAQGISYAWPLIPSFIVGYAATWCGHIALQAYYSNREVGLYQASFQLLLLIVSVPAPIATILLPRLFESMARDPGAERRFVEQVIPTLAGIWFPVAILIVAVAPPSVEKLYGEQFGESSQLLAILCAGVPGIVLTTLYGVLFSVQARLGRTTLYLGIMAAVNSGLAFGLVPHLGVVGAAVATAMSYIVSQWCYLLDQHRHIGSGHRAIGILFLIALVYAAWQAFLPEALYGRISLALGFIAIIGFLCRHFDMVNKEVVARLFSGRLSLIGEMITRVLVVKPSS